jgi:BCD family chlorophyll transporter-like MFS transporter
VSVLAMSGALGEVLVTPITAYSFVYHLEMYLLFVVLVALGPMLRASRMTARETSHTPSTPFGLAQLPG